MDVVITVASIYGTLVSQLDEQFWDLWQEAFENKLFAFRNTDHAYSISMLLSSSISAVLLLALGHKTMTS
jgi:hypothetical protein